MSRELGQAMRPAQSGLAPEDPANAVLKKVFDAAPEAILVLDARGAILHANRAAESMFAYTRAEIEGRPASILLPAVQPGVPPDTPILPLLRGDFPAPGIGGDFLGRRKNGDTFPVAVELRIAESAGAPIAIAYISDVAQRKKLESRLIDVQRIEVAGHLVGSIVHDFNNLLTIINGHSHILHDQLPSPDPLRDNAREILNAVQRSSSLVKELLSFSRKQCAPAGTATPLNGAIYDMDGMMRRLLPAGMELTFRLSPRAGFVAADRGRIDQVLINLVLNARDALRGRGGRIHIATRRARLTPRESHAAAGIYSVLTIHDDGCGMDEAARERLFEPFFTTKSNGTGLGLATVQRIVHQAGGLIRVKSAVNQGTTFTLCLPRVEGAAEPAVAQPAATPAGTETILLVEDEDGIRRLITTILRKRGYQVLEARGAREAQQIAQQPEAHIDLLLTDVNLPDASGGAVAESLLRLDQNVKVLYVSGHSEEQAVHSGLVAPGARFLPKPFTVDELVKHVRSVLDED